MLACGDAAIGWRALAGEPADARGRDSHLGHARAMRPGSLVTGDRAGGRARQRRAPGPRPDARLHRPRPCAAEVNLSLDSTIENVHHTGSRELPYDESTKSHVDADDERPTRDPSKDYRVAVVSIVVATSSRKAAEQSPHRRSRLVSGQPSAVADLPTGGLRHRHDVPGDQSRPTDTARP